MDKWFSVPKVTINGVHRPDFVSGLRWTAVDAPGKDSSDTFLIRVYGTKAELDALAAQPGVDALPETSQQGDKVESIEKVMAKRKGRSFTKAELESKVRINADR